MTFKRRSCQVTTEQEIAAKIHQDTKNHIEQFGLSVIHVINSHSYSIGCRPILGFDLIFTIGDAEAGHYLINKLCRLLKEQPLTKSVEVFENILNGYGITLVEVPVTEEFLDSYVRQAVNYYEKENNGAQLGDLRFVQVVIPDSNHHYPWDSHYNQAMIQPLLFSAGETIH
nr:DUF4262 domain-containing protein [Shewanella algae]